MTAVREKLPKNRRTSRFELRLGGHKLFVDVGLYEDGRPGEVFLTMSKEGSDLRHFAQATAIAISLLLQYGAPIDGIVHSLEKLAGGPCGKVEGHDEIRSARSMVDLVAQLLKAEYGKREQHSRS